MPKLAVNLSGLHNLKSLQSMGKRSIPTSSKSAWMDLFMLQNKKDRLLQERVRVRGRRVQLNKEIVTIRTNMSGLLKIAIKSMKGEKIQKDSVDKDVKKHNGSTVLEY